MLGKHFVLSLEGRLIKQIFGLIGVLVNPLDNFGVDNSSGLWCAKFGMC